MAERIGMVADALREAARRFGTPLYATDLAALDDAAAAVVAAFPDPWLRAFSVKANDVPAVVAEVAARGFAVNVVSRGEWAIARRAGVGNAATTVEGVGKTDADLRAVVRAAAAGDPVRWVAVESADEARALARMAAAAGLHGSARPDVLLRLNPAVSPETLRGLAVGAARSKFGLADDEIADAIEAGGGRDGPLRWRGIHLHVGSQLGAVDAWRDAVRRALAVGALLRGEDAAFDTLDVGGGFPVAPDGDDATAPTPARFAAELPALLDAVPADRRPARLAIEPGRYLVARAGLLVARVLHVRARRGPDGGPMVVLDAGMAELVRPALFGARHRVVALTADGRPVDPARPAGGAVATAVEGPICESTDALGIHDLPPLRRGDLVVVRDAGAYGASMASRYNGRPRPPQVLVRPDGGIVLARRRGSLASLT
jgi:diaminopimelate decarboxylase